MSCDIESFHDQELVDYEDAALAEAFFGEWIRRGGPGPSNSQCVGYKRPLLLGGVDAVENLELIDLDVYWTPIYKPTGFPTARVTVGFQLTAQF
ncbi:hypothetical protein BTH42_11190 [Burkholderia sp. SRS-W-2-2016]|nr:T6SS immunity protein Tdi1 domain-containing protein [Burkholderia sp. SRS-W-2-2016]OLL31498.1 hypothetical protein BTH42_11190 [Burkholderia sp. SRS-W-2-2016]